MTSTPHSPPFPRNHPNGNHTMQHIAIIYHSAHGHTAHIAQQVCQGAQGLPGIHAELVRGGERAGAELVRDLMRELGLARLPQG